MELKRLSIGEGLYYELGWEQKTKCGGGHKEKKESCSVLFQYVFL